MIVQRTSVVALLSCMLAACGGGGGGGGGGASPPPTSSPPPAAPTADDLARAQNAKLHMTLDVPSRLVVTWLDTFDNEQGYTLQRRGATGVWELVAALPALDGGSGFWEGSILGSPGTYRLSATFRDFSLPLYAAPGESEIVLDVAAPPAQLLTAPEPNGGLRVSVLNAAPAQSVSYYTTGVRVANVTSGGDFSAVVPFARILPNASIAAHVHKSAGLTLRTLEPYVAGHNNPALVLDVAPAPTSNALSLTAKAHSYVGIVSVQFFANGQLLTQLNEPDRFGNWVHTIDPASLASSTNTFRAVATDAAGALIDMEVEHTLETLPALTVAGLFDGMIVSGDRLNIHGTFGENAPGTVLSIEIGYRNIPFRTRTSPFSFDYPIAGLSGPREVIVRAESPSGRTSVRTYLINLPSNTHAFELVATDAARLLAADAGTLLYQKRSGAVVMRNAAGVETPFVVPAGMTFSNWYLTGGRVLAQERVGHRLKLLSGVGETFDLLPWWLGSFTSNVRPVLRGDWIAFTPGIGFAIYSLTTGLTQRIEPPAATIYVSYDIDTTPGNERLLFPAQLANGERGIFGHSWAMDSIELVAPGAFHSVRVDGTRVVGSSDTGVFTAPLNNPSAMTALSSRSSNLVLKDGWLCFSSDTSAIAIHDGSSTVELSTSGSCDENSIADGRLLFFDATGLNSWRPATGKQHLLTASGSVLHTQGVAYLLTGSSDGALYRTTLP